MTAAPGELRATSMTFREQILLKEKEIAELSQMRQQAATAELEKMRSELEEERALRALGPADARARRACARALRRGARRAVPVVAPPRRNRRGRSRGGLAAARAARRRRRRR